MGTAAVADLVHVESAAHPPVRGQEAKDGGAGHRPALPEALFQQGPLSVGPGGDALHVGAGKLQVDVSIKCCNIKKKKRDNFAK